MKKSKGMQLGAMLAAMLIVSMALVPAVSANTNLSTAEKLAHQYSESIWGKNNTDIIDSKLYYGLDKITTPQSMYLQSRKKKQAQ